MGMRGVPEAAGRLAVAVKNRKVGGSARMAMRRRVLTALKALDEETDEVADNFSMKGGARARYRAANTITRALAVALCQYDTEELLKWQEMANSYLANCTTQMWGACRVGPRGSIGLQGENDLLEQMVARMDVGNIDGGMAELMRKRLLFSTVPAWSMSWRARYFEGLRKSVAGLARPGALTPSQLGLHVYIQLAKNSPVTELLLEATCCRSVTELVSSRQNFVKAQELGKKYARGHREVDPEAFIRFMLRGFGAKGRWVASLFEASSAREKRRATGRKRKLH
jgi:hypothetical protein